MYGSGRGRGGKENDPETIYKACLILNLLLKPCRKYDCDIILFATAFAYT
jgi:hypothetical protein